MKKRLGTIKKIVSIIIGKNQQTMVKTKSRRVFLLSATGLLLSCAWAGPCMAQEEAEQVSSSTFRQDAEATAEYDDGTITSEGQKLFASLPEIFTFSSGVGAWGTQLSIAEDGTFTGSYHDSEMGSTGEGYPKGTVYFSNFSGKFSEPVQVNQYVYSMNLETLETEGTIGDSYIEDEIRYVYSEPYGLNAAKEFLVYLPGTPVSSVAQSFLSWSGLNAETESALPAGFYGLYNVQEQFGFTGRKEDDQPNAGDTVPASSGEMTDTYQGDYASFLQESLVPQYGLMDTQEQSFTVERSGQGTSWGSQDVTGLLSASSMDFDGDGQEELLAVYFETNPDESGTDTSAKTELHLMMYERDQTAGQITKAAEKIVELSGSYLADFHMLQTCCFTYAYGGKRYVAVDNNFRMNESITSLVLYSYDGSQFVFEKGMGYQEQGAGDVVVHQANAEPGGEYGVFCGSFAEDDPLNTWENSAYYWIEDSASYAMLTKEEERQYYQYYSSLLEEWGLEAADSRLWVNQENDLDYVLYNVIYPPQIYTSLEGEIQFLSSVITTYPSISTMILIRNDYGNTLGTYRTQSSLAETGTESGTAANGEQAASPTETEAAQGDYILPDSNSRYLTEADLEALTPQQICYAKNEIYARHGRKFQSSELTAYFNSQPWYQGTIEPEDFTEDTVNMLFNEYEKVNVRFISDWEKVHGEYAPQ